MQSIIFRYIFNCVEKVNNMEDYLKLDVKRVYSPLALSVPKYEKSTRKDHQKQHTSFSILDLEGALV